MTNFVLKELLTDDIEFELKQIGFDEGYRFVASDKYRYKNIKIYALSVAQANILKQTALSYGADCATHRDTITGNINSTDVVLGGSYTQLEKIASQLKKQPFSLGLLGEEITNLLKPVSNKTKLVGILNVTPDSFSDGARGVGVNSGVNSGVNLGLNDGVNSGNEYIERLSQLIKDGADIIDIGAESTRPGFTPVDDDEQIRRLKPVLDYINKESKLSFTFSVDTRSSVVAEFALENGVKIINDVSGFDNDEKMAEVVAKYKAGVVIQHSKDVTKSNRFIDEIYFDLEQKIEYARSKGIQDIIIDLGFGFGKTAEQSFEILERFKEFNSLGCPIMLGVSRKSLLGLGHSDDNDLKDALTAALSYPLIKSGIDYLRVHNVKLHKHMLNLA